MRQSGKEVVLDLVRGLGRCSPALGRSGQGQGDRPQVITQPTEGVIRA